MATPDIDSKSSKPGGKLAQGNQDEAKSDQEHGPSEGHPERLNMHAVPQHPWATLLQKSQITSAYLIRQCTAIGIASVKALGSTLDALADSWISRGAWISHLLGDLKIDTWGRQTIKFGEGRNHKRVAEENGPKFMRI